jgi:hypothetical protein
LIEHLDIFRMTPSSRLAAWRQGSRLERIRAWRMRVNRDAAPPWNSTSRGLAAMPEFLFEPLFAAR